MNDNGPPQQNQHFMMTSFGYQACMRTRTAPLGESSPTFGFGSSGWFYDLGDRRCYLVNIHSGIILLMFWIQKNYFGLWIEDLIRPSWVFSSDNKSDFYPIYIFYRILKKNRFGSKNQPVQSKETFIKKLHSIRNISEPFRPLSQNGINP